MKGKSLVILGGLLALLPLIGSLPAEASNDKTYTGFMCSALTPSDLPYIQAGRNLDPVSARAISCPIVRDTMLANVLPLVRIWVRDHSPEKSLTCTLYSKISTGEGNVAIQTRRVSDLPEPSDPVNIPYLMEFHNVPAGNYGFYQIACLIPPSIERGQDGGKSGVVGYWVVEDD
jgi:hypothetical protein